MMQRNNHTQGHASQHHRILFFAEAVTLAHAVRPVALAQSLDPQRFTAILAWDNRYRGLFPDLALSVQRLHSISSAQFNRALAVGKPVYDAATLRSYVRADLALIEKLTPALVVGDFRLSLAVSARVAGVPYITITNAYWSPYASLPLPLPEHPMARVLSITAAERLFRLARPWVFAYHSLPLNRVRREYGLPSLGYDLRETYTHADQVLYADIPGLVPTAPLPPQHHWLGPVLWSPQDDLPDWWEHWPLDKPLIYVTLGSSGDAKLLPVVLHGLADLPVSVIAATAGQPLPADSPANAWVAPYLPGVEAAARAVLVICNGGSPTTQQALAGGVPVIGIVSNMDQHLNMLCLEQHGVGVRLRAGQLTVDQVRRTVKQMLDNIDYRNQAGHLAQRIKTHDTYQIFAERVAEQLQV